MEEGAGRTCSIGPMSKNGPDQADLGLYFTVSLGFFFFFFYCEIATLDSLIRVSISCCPCANVSYLRV